MPELPEVETTKTSLKPLLNNQVTSIKRFRDNLRLQIPDNLDVLNGYQLVEVKRRAKYLLLAFEKTNLSANQQQQDSVDAQKVLIIHLGMSGSLQQYPLDAEKRKHDHVIFTFRDVNQVVTQLHYHDPRRFGMVVWADEFEHKLLGHLGVEPLTEDFTAQYLYDVIHRISVNGNNKSNKQSKKPISKAIKSVIMDQEFVVGVGNIYATESLFLSNIHPATPACLIHKDKLQILVTHIKAILAKAIEQGGSTLKDFTVSGGTTGYFQQTLLVYGKDKQPCPSCDNVLESIKINGRASVFCSSCQPLPE